MIIFSGDVIANCDHKSRKESRKELREERERLYMMLIYDKNYYYLTSKEQKEFMSLIYDKNFIFLTQVGQREYIKNRMLELIKAKREDFIRNHNNYKSHK